VVGLAVCLSIVLPRSTEAEEVPLSLEEAVVRALEFNPSAQAALEAENASKALHSQAVSRFFPRVDYIESYNRSDNPVFVFGSLLNQGRFTEENFDIDRLNNPDPVSNFRSQFVLQQPIFVGGRNYLGREGARIGVDMAAEGKKMADMHVIFETLRTYFGVQVSERNFEVISEALETAQEDLNRAQALYDAGMVTEVDLLSIRVHLGALREQQIRAENDLKVMSAELSQTLGLPLDSDFTLLTPLEYQEREVEGLVLEELFVEAIENQPSMKMKELEVESFRLERKKANSMFLPTVAFNAGWESNRPRFTGGGQSNWLVGVTLHVNLFQSLGKFYGSKAAAAGLRKAEAEKKKADDAIRLEIRRAYLDREAAAESVEVARQAVSQARESHRITEARYEGGLANVTELLRSQNALLQAEAQYLGSIYGGRLAEARLELAVGTLHKESGAVKP
jgi:outer membrane protein TolC